MSHLAAENAELRARLREAQDTLAAIHGGHVDAVVVQTAEGPQIFTLTSADAASSQLRGEMLAQINEAVVALDVDQRITYLNAAAEVHFGCDAADALGRHFGEVVRTVWSDPADEAAARAALEIDGRWHGACVHHLPDGREMAVTVSLSTLRDVTHQRSGTLAVVRDETQRRQAEHRLLRLTERYDAALAAAPVVLFEQDQALRYTWIHNMVHFAEAQLLGKRDFDVFTESPDDALRLEAIKRSVLESGQPRHEEIEVQIQGKTLCYELFVRPRSDAAGRTVGLVCAAVDLTEHKKADAGRAELAERLQLAVRHAGLGTWDWDLRTNAVGWSPECYAVFGVPEGEFEGSAAAFAGLVHPNDRERVSSCTKAAIEQRTLYECDFRILRRKDGALRWVTNIGRASYDGDGQPLRMVGTVSDITDRKRTEQALRDEAQRKDEFLALLAHELRNPLAPVRMTVGLLSARAGEDAVVARCRDIIERQTAQMARLLDDLLDVSRLSRGKVELELARVTLGEVIDAALETCRPLNEKQSHQLVVELSQDARAFVLLADAARLVGVFSNLFNNAAKYSHPGGRIEVSATLEQGQGVVWVRDKGIGISPEVLPHLFELFVQSSEARRHAPGGLGIGLSMVSRLVQLHGGSVVASSAGPGRGSEFCVRLPPAPPAPASASASGRPEAAALQPVRRRVLVADDNVDAADMTALLLQTLGCEVCVVNDGESALREADRLRPDVVLLDLGMPGLDGYETCRRIRAQPWSIAMALVALSGWSREEDRFRSREAGFDLHLAKPVEPSVLIQAVRDARQRGNGSEGASRAQDSSNDGRR